MNTEEVKKLKPYRRRHSLSKISPLLHTFRRISNCYTTLYNLFKDVRQAEASLIQRRVLFSSAKLFYVQERDVERNNRNFHSVRLIRQDILYSCEGKHTKKMEKISISVNSGNLLLSPPNETRSPAELHPYSDSTSFSNNFPTPSFAILASFILSCILQHCLFSFKIYSIYSTNATRLYYALKNTVLP